MSRVIWLLFASGCQYVFPFREPSRDAADSPTCSDPRLIACYELDDQLTDGGLRANHIIGSGGAPVFVDGIDGGRALQLTLDNRFIVANPDFEGEELTIDVWLKYQPSADQQIVIDHDLRWALSLTPTGLVTCHLASGVMVSGATPLTPNVFTHVACTQRAVGQNASMQVYVDAMRVVAVETARFQMTPTTVVGIGSNAPDSTDSYFLGAMDRLRIWNVALDDEEIAVAASAERP